MRGINIFPDSGTRRLHPGYTATTPHAAPAEKTNPLAPVARRGFSENKNLIT